jgi:hypothetical protein
MFMTTINYEHALNLLRRESQGDALSSEELSSLRERYTRHSELPGSALTNVSLDQQDPRLLSAQQIR